jgi:DNA replication protein DnaC
MTSGVFDVLARIQKREADEAAKAGISVDELRARREAIEADEQKRKRQHAEKMRADEIQRRLEEAGVPARAQVFDVASLAATPAVRAVREAGDAIINVLAGSPGVGKTVAAALWMFEHLSASERWQYGGSAEWTTGGERMVYRWTGGKLVWRSAGDLARTDHYSREAVGEIETADRLVIDDLGAEYTDAKGFFLSLLDEIINARYGNNRPTVITTNLDVMAFRNRYGERIADRIREAGRFVNCGAKSLRGKAQP